MIRFTCPRCHKVFQAEDAAADKQLKCPQCGVALAKAPLSKAVPLAGGARAGGGPWRQEAAKAPLASAAGGSWRSLVLPLSIGGGVLVVAAVVLTLWVAGYMSGPQTAALDHREDDLKQAADQPSRRPGEAIATPAAQPAPPADVAPVPAVPAPPAPAATPAAKPVAAVPPPPPATVPVSLPAVGPGGVMDVLRQINPVRDSARGTWTFQGTGLASPRNEMGVLRLPVTPPAEYRLTVVVERMSPLYPSRIISAPPPQFPPRTRPPVYRGGRPPSRGVPQPRAVPQPGDVPQPYQETPPSPEESDEGLRIVLSVEGHPAALVLDGFQRTLSGLELIDGKGVEQNGTAFHGEVLARLRAVTVICTVGPGSVDATVDGRTVVHWTGKSDLLAIESGLAADVGNGLALVASSQFRVQRIELVSLGGAPLLAAVPGVAASVGPATTVVYPATPGVVVVPGGQARVGVAPSPQAVQCVALIAHPLGSGSGFAIDKQLVVTNAHVAEGVFPDEIKVQFGMAISKPQPATRILYFDRPRDLCVIEVPSELAGLPVRGDYKFNSGDRVTLVGNPSAGGGIVMRNAVNYGRFSSLVHIQDQDYYQIDASVNPGWSGGPVLDAEGKVVAIVAMKAADKAVMEIRGAMIKLDQDFRARIGRTSYGVGLTYGIPASALGDVLKDPALHDEEHQAEANDKCAAKTLADRLSFLAEISMLRIQTNVPKQVRSEAVSLAHRKPSAGSRHAPPPADIMTFMSEFEAARLGRLLDDERIKSIESKFRERLDERIGAVQASEHLPDPIKHDLRSLATKVRDAGKFIDHPPTTYASFSTKVKGFSHDFKELLKRLAENLKEKES
jgi:S1-C subfamily serine protease